MLDLLSLTLPIFLLIGLGFAAKRLDLVTREQIGGIATFVLYFALPSLILHALASQDLRSDFEWGYLFAYGLGSGAVFLLEIVALRVVLKRPLERAGLAALGSSTSNSGFMGFPIAHLALGAPALTALPLCMLVENLMTIPAGLGLGEAGVQEKAPLGRIVANSLGRLARSPLILAIATGAVLSFVGVDLPGPVSKVLQMLADASAPCALFVVGGTLAALGGETFTAEVPWIVVGKLVLHPLAVTGAFMLVPDVAPELRAAGILFASMPMIAVYPILGRRFGVDGMCAAALLAATVTGFVTVTLALGLVTG